MRTLLAVVIPVLLASATTASAQLKKTGSRAARTSPGWAVSYQDPNIANAPPVAEPPATVAPLPQNTAQAAPAVALAAPVAHGADCGGKCGHKHGDKCCKLLDWFCYRRSASCAKGCGCCYWCSPPLYSYFGCDCREGAKHGTMEPKPCPPSGCGRCAGWGKYWSPGTQMFASPTAHGVVGVR